MAEKKNMPITVGNAVIIGTISSAIAIFLLVGLGLWAVTGSAGGPFALGAFCAAWGGPGFGVMVGGVMNAMSEEKLSRANRAAPSAAPATPAPTTSAVAH